LNGQRHHRRRTGRARLAHAAILIDGGIAFAAISVPAFTRKEAACLIESKANGSFLN
jgi:hypothetical protein